jgi:lysophospholipase L1-like esterase
VVWPEWRRRMKQVRTSLMVVILAAFAALAVNAVEQKPAAPEAGVGSGKAAAQPKPKPNEPVEGKTNGEKWWRGNYDRISADIKKMDGNIDIAFVGDSITARWRGGQSWSNHWGSYRAVNMGIGGDQTQNVLWRLKNGHLDGYKAKLFVVLIGTNNLWDKNADPAEVADGIKAILDLIQSKQPEANILLLSTLPLGEKPNPGREKRTAVNKLISKFAGGKVHYMDIADKFLEPDGTISKEVMHDSLHLGSKGFDIWAEAIKGKVNELIGEAKPAQKP